MAALLQFETARDQALQNGIDVACKLINWHSASPVARPLIYEGIDAPLPLRLTPLSEGTYLAEFEAEGKASEPIELTTKYKLSYFIKDKSHIGISIDGRDFNLTNQVTQFEDAAQNIGAGDIIAPMHGAIKDVFVKPGDKVKKGQRLAVLDSILKTGNKSLLKA